MTKLWVKYALIFHLFQILFLSKKTVNSFILSLPSVDDLLILWRAEVNRPADPDQTEALQRQASAHSELLNRMAGDGR